MCEILIVVGYVWPEILIVPVGATVTLDCTVHTVVIGRAAIPATSKMCEYYKEYLNSQLHFTNMNTIKRIKGFMKNSRSYDFFIFEPPNKTNRYELI